MDENDRQQERSSSPRSAAASNGQMPPVLGEAQAGVTVDYNGWQQEENSGNGHAEHRPSILLHSLNGDVEDVDASTPMGIAPPWHPQRARVRAQERSEEGWEDTSSDEETRMSSLASKSEVMRAASTASATSAATEDAWEDEESPDLSDSDSGDSSATEAPLRGIDDKTDSLVLPDNDRRRKTRCRTSHSRMSSAQRATYDYKQSKMALANTDSDNVARYKRLMGGQQETNSLGDREMKRTATADRLQLMEPFVASRSAEPVDEADAPGRARRMMFPNSSPLSGSHASHRGNADSSSSSSGSPPCAVERLSSSPSKSPALLASAEREHRPLKAGLLQFAAEEYASEPSSPAHDTPPAAEWITTYEVSADQQVPNGTHSRESSAGRNVHIEKEKDDPSTPRPARIATSSKIPQRQQSPSGQDSNVLLSDGGMTPEMISSQLDQLSDAAPPFSLWDYLKEEVMATDFDSTQEMKWERVTNFIAIPFHMEKIMLFGFFVCLDSFLYTFTILPLRFAVALFLWARNLAVWLLGGPKRYLHSSHKCDLLKTLLIVSSCWVLSRITDASKMYHSVRGQDVIKLYVIFNVLEIADRLCCSFGQDLLDSLFSRVTLARRKDGRQPYLRPLGFFTLSLFYVFAHTLVLLYQLVTLNVAINSYDNALLTLLLSNQFVEIKGSVFKKFEKENLFQLTCADIVERFQLALMLCSIGLRNLIEMTGAAGNSVAAVQADTLTSQVPNMGSAPSANKSGGSTASSLASSSLSALAMLGPLPTSFTVFPSFSLLETIFTPVCIVLASECLVDWLKHAFITKFNHIRPSVYGRFMDVLCRDLVVAGPAARDSSRRKHSFVDQSPVVSRRLGFAAVPLACLLVRMASQVMSMLEDDSHFDECASPDWARGMSGGQGGQEDTNSTVIAIWHLARRPLLMLAHPLVADPAMRLDMALAYLGRGLAWILTVVVAWVSLVALKLILGTNLVSFASRRYATLAQREREEELNARNRAPIGVDKDERAYDAKLAKLLDKPDDDATRIGASGQQEDGAAAAARGAGGGGKEKNPAASLMDVSRYTMVRSRIW